MNTIIKQEDVLLRQADSDQQLIALWLHGRPATTQRTYQDALKRLADFTGKPLSI